MLAVLPKSLPCRSYRSFGCWAKKFQKRYFNSFEQTKEKENELVKFIKQKIRLSGPITVADYMRMTANSPSMGYYSRHGADVFGEEGDFITAPEISQIFGELIGIWCIHELGYTGHRKEWQLIESGPGTGQLMSDIARVFKKLNVEKVSLHLVETSEAMILHQEKVLCDRSSEFVDGKEYVRENETKNGYPVYWYRDISEIAAQFSVFISNEFLDALPVNQFKRDADGKWHEIYVALNEKDEFCFMLSRAENIHTVGLIPEAVRNEEKRMEWEISLDAGTYINQIADHMTRFGGFGLMIDYGHDGSRQDLSLRAYKKHKLVHPLEDPGQQDLTADVNFGHLKSLVEDRVLVYGPVEQSNFLAQMGFGIRLRRLLESCKSKVERDQLLKSSSYLMSDDEMGHRFKMLSLFPKTMESIMGKRGGSPAGFGIL